MFELLIRDLRNLKQTLIKILTKFYWDFEKFWQNFIKISKNFNENLKNFSAVFLKHCDF